MKFLEAATKYASKGWPVFPLDGKEPLTTHGVKDATTDPTRIEKWDATWPNANIGLACGENSVVVLDFDKPIARETIKAHVTETGIKTAEEDLTTVATKTANGYHLYYSWSEGCDKLKNWASVVEGLDIRTEGGYVVMPPSVHPDTKEPYEWITSPDDGELKPLPTWLLDFILEAKNQNNFKRLEEIELQAKKSKFMNGDREKVYAKTAFEDEIRILRDARVGERNDQLNTSALKLGRLVGAGLLNQREVESELETVACSIGLVQSEIMATIRSGMDAGMCEPRDIPDPIIDDNEGIETISEDELLKIESASRPKLRNRLEPANFITQYVGYGSKTCDAYPEYHYSGALTLLSVAVGRKLVIKLKQGRIYPNIWAFNLGPSTISRKSTAVAKMEDMLMEVCPDGAIPKAFSPEALIEFLSECPVSYLVKDEVGQLLSSMRKQYMEDIRDFFSEIYDNRDFRRKLRTGKRKDKTDFKIANPYIVQSYATTNTLFREYTTSLDITSGWLLRFIYFAPNYKKASMAFEVETEIEANLYGNILGRFSGLHRLFAQIDEEIEIKPEDEAMAFYQDWQMLTEYALVERNDEVTLALWGRLSVYALKLATLFTVGKDGYRTSDKISLDHMKEACRQIDEYFLPVGQSVAEEVGRQEQTNLQNKIIGTLERRGGKMQRPELLRALHVKLNDVSEAMKALAESEEIEIRKEERQGRKSVIWYILNRPLSNSSNNSNNHNNSNNRNNRTDSSVIR